MKRFIINFLISEDGPTAVEYAVMLAMIVMACIASIRLLGTGTATSFNNSSSQITAAMGS
ncbi:MAG: Flp family type IVb pilin [Pirellulales bacterium]